MTQANSSHYGRFQINQHDRVVIGGKAMRLVYQSGDSYILRSTDDVGLAETFSSGELARLNGSGKIFHEPDYFLPEHARQRLVAPVSRISDLTPKQRARLRFKQAYVSAYLDMHAEGLVAANDPSIELNMTEICSRGSEYLREVAPSPDEIQRENEIRAGKRRRRPGGKATEVLDKVHARTLRKWVAAYREFGLAGLADNMSNRGNRNSYFTPEERALLVATVRESYLSPNRPSKANTYVDVKAKFFFENQQRVEQGLSEFRIPSRETVRNTINDLDKFEVVLNREGRQAAEKMFKPVGRGLEIARPYEKIQIDEWKIDLITLMADSGLLGLFSTDELLELGLNNEKARWWITAAIDCRTRCFVGMKLARNPKASGAIDCLRMSMCDKGEWADRVGAVSGWHMAATPEMVVTDNGSAFKSGVFTDVCAELWIVLERTIAGIPGMRGTVERLFRTAGLTLLHRLNGRTFSSVLERGDHPSEDRACLTSEDLCYALVRWIVDIYHNTPHSGLGGRTPLEQWRTNHEAGNYPLRAAPHEKHQRLAFGTRLSRKVSKNGVTVLGVRYHFEGLAAWFLRYGNTEVEVRWLPDDIGSIEVRLGDIWETVQASHSGFSGVHAQVWMEARRSLRTKDQKALKWRDRVVFEAIDAINMMNQQRSLEFGLISQNWSPERVKKLEDSLFVGFNVSSSSTSLNEASSGYGEIISPAEPDDLQHPKTTVPPRTEEPEPNPAWTIKKGEE
ncbi:Mu transposase C-terminal domain-containing protein [Ruegeria lacuscaerulensis]|uniref:Mu transposase C-terminal domain-containing protein n=1 Tax=Ruegeria lacuscaerulensis TaxID=55218 RepID=UPI00147C452A|nr:Mu transposase C-terminal domain-containing protein [Ruegeria lacuscaerulensis]